ncbi:MAG: tRNA (adenosine(37)-N6)-threonylcarbamoyltransferase complex ATPase subunit type 1 TsaE [Thermodesulfobacteriota bacterium]
MEVYHTSSPEETGALAGRIAPTLNRGEVLILSGELGTGKTTFVKGLADGLGLTGLVRSPTFTVVNIYRGPLTLYHIDLYRIESGGELDDIGIDTYLFCGDGITVVEWGEKVEEALTDRYLSVRFFHDNGDRRRIEIEWTEPPGKR